MLHFAQVTVDRRSNSWQLQVLMTYFRDQFWQRNPLTLPFVNLDGWAEGALVLLETNETEQIQSIQDGVDWLLRVLPSQDRALTELVNTKFLGKEQQRVESWRQEMAAKNLELTRQKIELEAQRQQLQALEADLKAQKPASSDG